MPPYFPDFIVFSAPTFKRKGGLQSNLGPDAYKFRIPPHIRFIDKTEEFEMYTCPIELSDVRYNAANQQFEAAVTVHDNSTVRTYACAIEAPISTSFEDAAQRLGKTAIEQHQNHGGLFSETQRFTPLKNALIPPKTRSGWLRRMLQTPQLATV